MNRRRHRRAALLSLLFLALVFTVPVGLAVQKVTQDRLNHALIDATRRANDRAAIRLLKEGADANCREKPSWSVSPWRTLLTMLQGKHPQQASDALTPLAYAAGAEAIEDADLEQRKLLFGVAQIYVLIPGATENIALIRALLRQGARIDTPVGHDQRTPLYYALRAGRRATAHLLLASGAKATGPHTGDFLFLAIGKPDLVADLIAHGANVNGSLQSGDTTPLMQACSSDDVESVRLLLAHHASVEDEDEEGRNALGFVREPDASTTPVERISRREIVRLLKAVGGKK